MKHVVWAAVEAALLGLEDDDSLRGGLTKLLLVGFSAAVAWGAVWVTCVAQFGSAHSLAGWMLPALLAVWRLVVWVWELLLWRPPAWDPVQVRGK